MPTRQFIPFIKTRTILWLLAYRTVLDFLHFRQCSNLSRSGRSIRLTTIDEVLHQEVTDLVGKAHYLGQLGEEMGERLVYRVLED